MEEGIKELVLPTKSPHPVIHSDPNGPCCYHITCEFGMIKGEIALRIYSTPRDQWRQMITLFLSLNAQTATRMHAVSLSSADTVVDESAVAQVWALRHETCLWLPSDKTVSHIHGQCYVVLLLVHRFHASRSQQWTNSTGSRRLSSKGAPPCPPTC